MSNKLMDELKADVISLLSHQKNEKKEITFARFWNLFKLRFNYLPNPECFGVNSRGKILELCSDVVSIRPAIDGERSNKIVSLRIHGGTEGGVAVGKVAGSFGSKNNMSSNHSGSFAHGNTHRQERQAPYSHTSNPQLPVLNANVIGAGPWLETHNLNANVASSQCSILGEPPSNIPPLNASGHWSLGEPDLNVPPGYPLPVSYSNEPSSGIKPWINKSAGPWLETQNLNANVASHCSILGEPPSNFPPLNASGHWPRSGEPNLNVPLPGYPLSYPNEPSSGIKPWINKSVSSQPVVYPSTNQDSSNDWSSRASGNNKNRSSHVSSDQIYSNVFNQSNAGAKMFCNVDSPSNGSGDTMLANPGNYLNSSKCLQSDQLQANASGFQKKIQRKEIEIVANTCIQRLAESKEYVSLERITRLLLQHYSVGSITQLGLQNINELQCVCLLFKNETKINTFIQAYVCVRTISTVSELNEGLKSFTQKREFETLRHGPLMKLPVIQEYFKIMPDGYMYEITSAEVMQYLHNYLSENELWETTEKYLKLDEFMKFLTKKCGLQNLSELGVRISSMTNAVTMLKRAQNNCDQLNPLTEIPLQLQERLVANISTAYQSFTSSILLEKSEICAVRQDYLYLESHVVMGLLFEKLICIYKTMEEYQYKLEDHNQAIAVGKKRRTITRKRNKESRSRVLTELVNLLNRDEVFQKLLQLAICSSKEQIHQQIGEITGSFEPMSIPQFADSVECDYDDCEYGDVSERMTVEDRDKIDSSILTCLERCVVNGPLTLEQLSRIEEKLVLEFELKSFSDLDEKGFLKFILGNKNIRQFLDDSGGLVLGSISNEMSMDCPYQVSWNDMLEFMRQCKLCGIDEKVDSKLIEVAICNHYSAKDFKSLGHGTVSKLARAAAAENPVSPNRNSVSVYYESCLVAKKSPTILSQKYMHFGQVSADLALSCLQNCPLLYDMSDWSQWDLVFRPQLGDLKEFVRNHGGIHPMTDGDDISQKLNTDVVALEVCPGRLLRLTTKTDPGKFAAAALACDASSTSGHLVSMMALNGGIQNLPLALLGNHFRTALLTMQAQQSSIRAGSDQESSTVHRMASFVLDCLITIPLMICQVTVKQVILDPLGDVIGQTKSKDCLLDCATTTEKRSKLQALGMLLGILEWSGSFQNRTVLGKDCPVDAAQIGLDQKNTKEEQTCNGTDLDKELSATTDNMDTLDEGEKNLETSQDGDMQQISDSQCVSTISENRLELILESELNPTNFNEEKSRGDSCKRLIEAIRREEFGMNVELCSDGEILLNKQQERLGRSLERLSQDLYSKDTHFVLELVQNADDNNYDASTTLRNADVPSLKFLLAPNYIAVFNNEDGFTEKNIRALCDVGRTTKGKHKAGYIGQKGIGFKSVFRITDKPEIHSNGFHMRFDVESGPLGYILPHWIGESCIPIIDGHVPESWKTSIVLPLKTEMQNQSQTLSLSARFNDIHPSLLLFLHRLRNISVVNLVENYTIDMRRRDLDDHVVEISHGNQVDRWLVIRKTLDASKISVQAKSGVEVECTELSLAFPMPTKETVAAQVLPSKQPVFAFLPLRSYGFRFVINADFDLPSSREDVDRDSLWNQWLRSEIHHVFVDALDLFRSKTDLSPLEAVSYFFQFFPHNEEIFDFFRPVPMSIQNLLRAQPCLPTEELKWRIPSQLVICNDNLIRQVFPSSILHSRFGLDYLHCDVAKSVSMQTLRVLGVQTITTEHLIEFGKSIVEDLNSSGDTEIKICRISQWLLCIFKSLDEFRQNDNILNALKSLPVIPLVNGKFVRIESQTVFFPLAITETTTSQNLNMFSELQSDMCTLHPKLFCESDEVANSQISRLLEQLGVKKIVTDDIINHHIIPLFENSELCKQKPKGLLISYLVFIKEHSCNQSSKLYINRLKKCVLLYTNNGLKRPFLESVHFGDSYKNPISLELEFPGFRWTLLDSCYLQGGSLSHVQQWKEFFSQLGVLDFLDVRQRKIVLKRSDLASSPWFEYQSGLPFHDEYHICDYTCDEFTALVQSNHDPRTISRQLKRLFELIDSRWDAEFANFCTTKISSASGTCLAEVDTSFSLRLKSSSWIPATSSSLGSEQFLSVGKELFVPTELISHLFASHVSYSVPEVSENSAFAKHLGICGHVDAKLLSEHLLRWCARRILPYKTLPTSFTTSVSHMTHVYIYLDQHLSRSALQDLLKNHAIIFHTSAAIVENKDIPVNGQFLTDRETWWSDPSGLFQKYRENLGKSAKPNSSSFRCALDQLYPNLEEFFVRSCKIQSCPTIDDYVKLLEHIRGKTLTKNAVLDAVWIFSILWCEIAKLNLELIDIRADRFWDMKLIPSKARNWIGRDSNPLIADDELLEKIFSSNPEVHFVEFGENFGIADGKKSKEEHSLNIDRARRFLSYIGIPFLSQSVIVTPNVDSSQPCPELQLYAKSVAPYIQMFIFAEFPELYEHLVAKVDIGYKLSVMRFLEVTKLDVVYSMKDGGSVQPVVISERCKLFDDQVIYIHSTGGVPSYRDFNRELARFFSQSGSSPCPSELKEQCINCFRELKAFLAEILPSIQSNSDDELCHIVKERNLMKLPDDEKIWEIPGELNLVESIDDVLFHEDMEESNICQLISESSLSKSALQDADWDSNLFGPQNSLDFNVKSNKILTRNPGNLQSWPPMSDGRREARLKSSVVRDSQSIGNFQQAPFVDNEINVDKSFLSVNPGCFGQNRFEYNKDGDVSVDYQRTAAQRIDQDPNGMQSCESRQPTSYAGYNKRARVDSDRQSVDMTMANVPPVWLAKTDENLFELEHIETANTLDLPTDLTITDTSNGTLVGEWGERLVKNYLDKCRDQADSDIAKIQHVNFACETGLPYDFVVVKKSRRKIYLEVKTTTSAEKTYFQISINQLLFAREKGSAFHLYRVYSAGDVQNVRLCKIENLAEKMSQKSVQLLMLV